MKQIITTTLIPDAIIRVIQNYRRWDTTLQVKPNLSDSYRKFKSLRS
ncbi:MAG TPA: hypothetical protein VK203_27710 [Nostocaceae cyanobacterium]|nr:hypothetical protein [Nostocaceae cyanobacterium]